MWCIVKNATQKLGKIGSITIEIPKVAYVTGGGICCRPTFKLFFQLIIMLMYFQMCVAVFHIHICHFKLI